MSKKTGTIALIIAIVGLCCSLLSLGMGIVRNSADKAEEEGKETQYVMYIGTSDKDTYLAEFTPEEAKTIVDEVCLKYFEGYTLQEATGAWINEKNIPTHVYTLVCYLDGVDRDTVYQAADELLERLNQGTVLIEETSISMNYYSGSK